MENHLVEIKNNSSFILIQSYRNSPSEVSLGKGVLKYASNLQEKTHAEVWFQ